MAFVYADRVKEESTSVGFSAMVLTGAVAGFQTFADGIGDTNETYYTIFNGGDDTWEVGTGTYNAGSLTRDTVLASSNSGASVNFAAGTKIVFASVAAQFFDAGLDAVAHSGLNHTGIPGIPPPETFTAASHALVDHTTVPFNLLDGPSHNAINHKAPPFNLLDAVAHDLLDHTGLPGVNDFDIVTHAGTNHAGLPGIPAAETFTSPVHDATDHTGIPGVGAGKLVQQVRNRKSTIVTCNTGNPPWDNTVPQQTEGTEVLTVTITPTSLSNYLWIEFAGWGGGTPSMFIITALYRDAIANALGANSQVDYVQFGTAHDLRLYLNHYLQVPTLTPQTYKIRIGGNGTVHVNGHSSGTARFGGVGYANLTVTEIAP